MPRERKPRFSARMIRLVSPMDGDCAGTAAVWRHHPWYWNPIPLFWVLLTAQVGLSLRPMHARLRAPVRRATSAAALLWSCAALFGARVVGQLEALLVAPAWLPDMDTWYSGLMPYHFLLPAQIAILMLMAVVAWNRRVRGGQFARANPRAAEALRILAVVYFAVMAIRLAVNINENGADFWREGAIPVAFHWVLALFILVSGRASETMRGMRMPPQ